jgi:hypothetical protein
MRADLVPVGPAIHHGPTADQGPGKGRWPQHFLYFRARVARSAVWPEAAATAESTSRPSASWDEPASVFTRRVERPTLSNDRETHVDLGVLFHSKRPPITRGGHQPHGNLAPRLQLLCETPSQCPWLLPSPCYAQYASQHAKLLAPTPRRHHQWPSTTSCSSKQLMELTAWSSGSTTAQIRLQW